MKTTIEIKSVLGSLLFSYECENNTIAKTVKNAIECYANLRYANLRDANLRYANLSGADLRGANLRGANLSGADLRDANLRYADLSDAYLSDANLSDANLSYADLSDANLSYANLRGANLSGADLREGTVFLLSQCPSEGSFIGWKKCGIYIVKLLITGKRSSATTLKCRCSEVKTLEIQEKDGTICDINSVASDRDSDFVYKVGEISKVDDFDENKWNECSTGIHFFISREMAVKY